MTQEEIEQTGEQLRLLAKRCTNMDQDLMIVLSGFVFQLIIETSHLANATVSCARALERIATILETATGVRIHEEKRP